MTSIFGNLFGGLAYGGYWQASSQAQSAAANAAYTAYVGAITTSAARTAPEPTLEDAGVRAGEITGYRAWMVDEGMLYSMFMGQYMWRPGAVEHAPEVDERWGTGLHAFKSIRNAVQEYGCYAGIGQTVAFGEVALWGEVIEHELGYRAEYAAVQEICFTMRGFSTRWRHRGHWLLWETEVGRLRQRYGVAGKPAA